jgi:glycosyltransferase involved in cell wall biosynthesis
MHQSVGRVSIIIPAHNESRSLRHCLGSLLHQQTTAAVEVIVVANGCTDETADIARSWTTRAQAAGMVVKVIQTAKRSKTSALNLGDEAATGAVRAYLDADIVLSANAIGEVVRTFETVPGIHLCAPRLVLARGRSQFSRSYGLVWSSTPHVVEQVIGCGFYAVSAEGRRRWPAFPDITSDDKFVRLHFADREQRVVDTATMTIFLPERLTELLRVRGRWCRGNQEVERLYPELTADELWSRMRSVTHLARSPHLWAHLPIAALVYATGAVIGRAPSAARGRRWERASTSAIRMDGQASVPAPGPSRSQLPRPARNV